MKVIEQNNVHDFIPGTIMMSESSLNGVFPIHQQAQTIGIIAERPNLPSSSTYCLSRGAFSSSNASGDSIDLSDLINLGDQYIARARQKRRTSSPARSGKFPSLHTAGSANDLFISRESVSNQSPVSGVYSGYANSNYSSTSIPNYGIYDSQDSQNNYASSIHSECGIPDTNTNNGFIGSELDHATGKIASPDGLSQGKLSSLHDGDEIQDDNHAEVRLVERNHQTWEEFCELQLVAFLQICTLEDVQALTQSPALLKEQFELYLMRMIGQEGNLDFLSYQAYPRPGRPEAQLQLLRHHKSLFSESRSSIRSYSSRTSQISSSTTSSFSSQVSDDTMLNHAQQEAKRLKDCIIKTQNKLKYLEKESQGRQNSRDREGSAAELLSLRTLLETNETALQLLHSKEEALGFLGFSNISLLFTQFRSEFGAINKDLKNSKRQNKFQKMFKPGNSRRETGDRREKYCHMALVVTNMIRQTYGALEAAEVQKDAFITAGRPITSDSILKTASEAGYAPHDEYKKFPTWKLLTRQFLKINLLGLQRTFTCECCPKEPKKFGTAKELRAHETEKGYYECVYGRSHFKLKKEANCHTDLRWRRSSWSCAAISSHTATFYPSSTSPNGMETCGYCGEQFERTGPIDKLGMKIASERDWELRLEHLSGSHKFKECNLAKKFYRADHFKQHLKNSHSGTHGEWLSILERACIRDEHFSGPIPWPIRANIQKE